MASTAIKSDDIETRATTIEKASATQQDWSEHLAGRKGWTLNVGYLVLAPVKLRNVLLVGTTFDITLRYLNEDTTLTGKAILTNCKQTHTTGSLAQGTFTFLGNGPLQ